MYCLLRCTRVDIQVVEISDHVEMGTLSAYHLYGNFGEKIPLNGTFFFGTENRNGIELYHLQNTGKFFTFSRHEACHCC